MDARRFDELTKGLAHGASRRRFLKGLAGGVAAALAAVDRRPGAAQKGNRACAEFCRAVPPGPERGRCVSDCATGAGGLFSECDGDPNRLCIGTDGTATCCAGNQTCADGTCVCQPNYQFCAATDTCVFDNCAFNYRRVFNPETCLCVCQPRFVTLPGGGCAIGCATDEDCGGESGSCATSAGGLNICTNPSGYLPSCTPCETDADCYLGCSAINVFCEAGICRAAT